jgi:hypothetical protein
MVANYPVNHAAQGGVLRRDVQLYACESRASLTIIKQSNVGRRPNCMRAPGREH